MALLMQFEGNIESALKRFRNLPAEVQTRAVKNVRGRLLIAESDVLAHSGVTWRRGAAGLAGRLTSYCKRDSAIGLDGAIGFRKTTGFPYELSQEFGAKAKPGGAMSIPLSPEAQRFDSPRNFPQELHVQKMDGKAYLANEKGRPYYILLKSIKPRLRFRQNVARNVPAIGDAVIRAMGE